MHYDGCHTLQEVSAHTAWFSDRAAMAADVVIPMLIKNGSALATVAAGSVSSADDLADSVDLSEAFGSDFLELAANNLAGIETGPVRRLLVVTCIKYV